MALTASQLDQLHRTLLAAYTRDELRRLLRLRMDVDFDHVTAEKGQQDQVWELTCWANREGRAVELAQAAAAEKPANSKLRSLAMDAETWNLAPADPTAQDDLRTHEPYTLKSESHTIVRILLGTVAATFMVVLAVIALASTSRYLSGASPTPTAPAPIFETDKPTPTTIVSGVTDTRDSTEMPCFVRGVFKTLWQAHSIKLGCQTTDPITSPITYEPFERGYLVWKKLDDLIYVLPFDSTWSSHSLTWNQEEFACNEARTLGNPRLGFGRLWCTDEKTRTALGLPLDSELPNEFAQQQFFEGGIIMEIFGGSKLVLFEDGSWMEVSSQ